MVTEELIVVRRLKLNKYKNVKKRKHYNYKLIKNLINIETIYLYFRIKYKNKNDQTL